jgi:hypothetical protein
MVYFHKTFNKNLTPHPSPKGEGKIRQSYLSYKIYYITSPPSPLGEGEGGEAVCSKVQFCLT